METPDPTLEEPEAEGEAGRTRYLAFTVGGARFAVPLDRVHSVLRPVPVTPVPFTPPEVLGAINVRSTIVPLLDLRRAMALDSAVPLEESRFLVLEDDGRLRAVVVDREQDVVTPPDDEDAAPDLEAHPDLPGRALVGRLILEGDRLLAVLDPREVAALLEGV